MSVVIDANAFVALVTNEPAAPRVTELLHGWGSEGTVVNAPALARYEIANALAKKAAAGSLSDDAMQEAWTSRADPRPDNVADHHRPGFLAPRA